MGIHLGCLCAPLLGFSESKLAKKKRRLSFEQEVAESTEEWAFISAASVPSC